MTEGSRKAILAAFAANLGIAILKFIAFVITGSAGLLAEGVHSLADTGNQALLFLGGRRAKQQATPEHPFGYGRERYFWAFVVAVVLFTLGGAFAIYEGVEKLRHPHSPESLGWAVGVLVAAIVLESLSFRTAITEANHTRRGVPWNRFIRRSKAPELPVVLLEDFGALVGLTFALVGVVLATVTDNARFDAVGSLSIGILLCAIAIVLAIEMKSLLIGESAGPQVEAAIAEAIESHPLVHKLIHMRTEHFGPDELLVGAKLEFDSTLSFQEVTRAIDDVERVVRERVPQAEFIYIEPDCFRE